ncbi:hypothetical protein [Streptomyces cyaneofuscatus]|uniref:hypothetical protein n=2 Tax=Streptomyces TaxID=1883 RepID=UPI002E141AA4|nr:hypothetical protein OG366_12045 [Streptomyces cyaneofuscatus]
MNSRHLMALAEAVACLVLAGICVTLAAQGDALAWLFGLGSLSYGWDLWRRFGRRKAVPGPVSQGEH